MAKRNSGEMGPGCLVLFALPFAAVGIGSMVFMIWTAVNWMRMQRWEEVPAHVLVARLEVSSGDDSDTYKAVARYQYAFGDQEYEGTRVAIISMSDNLGNFHARAVDELKEHIASGEPFRCFVNPKSPQDSVLYRDLRVELLAFMLLFALAFGGVGFGLFIYGFKMLTAKKSAADHHGRSQNPVGQATHRFG